MKATIGRIVIVKGSQVVSNGTDEQPAIINRVWSPDRDVSDEPGAQGYINTTVLGDCMPPRNVTSVWLFASRAGAAALLAVQPGATVAFFPDRA